MTKPSAALALIVAIALPPALAQDVPMTPAAAAELALQSAPTVITARARLASAQRSLENTRADPGSLADARLRAEHGAELAAAQLSTARIQAAQEALQRVHAVLEAEATLAQARAAAALAAEERAVAEARRRAGAATELDEIRAVNAELAARADVASALDQVQTARIRLAAALGAGALEGELDAGELTVPPLPDLGQSRLATVQAGHSVDLIRARQDLAQAELGVLLADPVYATPSQIREARATLEDARDSRAAAEATARVNLAAAVASVQAVRATVDLRSADLDAARRAEENDQARLRAGLITQLTLTNSVNNRTRAENAYRSAVFRYREALLGLAVITGIVPDGVPGAAALQGGTR